jgi:hypothetical protein
MLSFFCEKGFSNFGSLSVLGMRKRGRSGWTDLHCGTLSRPRRAFRIDYFDYVLANTELYAWRTKRGRGWVVQSLCRRKVRGFSPHESYLTCHTYDRRYNLGANYSSGENSISRNLQMPPSNKCLANYWFDVFGSIFSIDLIDRWEEIHWKWCSVHSLCTLRYTSNSSSGTKRHWNTIWYPHKSQLRILCLRHNQNIYSVLRTSFAHFVFVFVRGRT